MKNETLFGEDDGLLIPEVGPWTEDKFDLIRLYCQMFSTSMKNKWPGKRLYVDLYAGSGLCRLEGRRQILLGSPLIALSVDSPFDKYIFCEKDPIRFSALSTRVARDFPRSNVCLINKDSDESVEDIRAEIPRGSLVLCFVDPFGCDFHFRTLRIISGAGRGVDFLCLLAVQMDAKRNVRTYLQPDSKIDRMLDDTTWRDRWNNRSDIHLDFAKFLALEFGQRMSDMQYLETPLYQMREVKTLDHNVPLYYIAMFSKHSKALDLWKEVLKYRTSQRSLFD